MSPYLESQLRDEVGSFGIELSSDQAADLVRYLEFVIEKNKVVNLTRITNPRDAVTLHLVDSLLPLACAENPLYSVRDLLDMGTGAGFPGVPLCLVCGLNGTLVDSVGKKTNAVNEGISLLGLRGMRAVHARLEELALDIPHSQDVVIARAVAQANVLIEYATPFLRKGGTLLLEKGNPCSEEIEVADNAAQICGLRRVSRETFELPRSLGHREIICYQRFRNSQISLPRKTGTAKKQPLGQ